MKSVLFVSHDVDLCAAAARALEGRGFCVTTAAHGGHAVLACVEQGAFEALIIEDELPEGPGAAIATRLRRHFPGLRVVRMCARADVGGPGIAVVRPFTADDLVDALDAVQTLRRTASL